MKDWIIEPPQRTGVTERLRRCSRMQPIEEAPRDHADEATVQIVARRLTTAYPARELTRVPAVAAASVLKRRWEVRQDDEEPAALWSVESGGDSGAATKGPSEDACGTGVSPVSNHGRDASATGSSGMDAKLGSPQYQLREPAFLERARPPDQTSRGTWTHEFLQRLDLRRPCDVKDLRAQLESMVDSGTMLADEVAAIDLDDMAWFFETPLGTRLRLEETRVLREWPFVMGVDPSRYDPSATAQDREDLMLVRGIIDCLFDSGEGWEILDYKTDVVTGDALTARADEYRGQLQIYAAATEAVWRRKVTRRWLAFLSARQVVGV